MPVPVLPWEQLESHQYGRRKLPETAKLKRKQKKGGLPERVNRRLPDPLHPNYLCAGVSGGIEKIKSRSETEISRELEIDRERDSVCVQ